MSISWIFGKNQKNPSGRNFWTVPQKMRIFLENLASSVWPLKLHIKFWSNSMSRFWEQLLTHLPEILTNWYTDILWGSFIRCFLPEGKGQKRDEKVSNWNLCPPLKIEPESKRNIFLLTTLNIEHINKKYIQFKTSILFKWVF